MCIRDSSTMVVYATNVLFLIMTYQVPGIPDVNAAFFSLKSLRRSCHVCHWYVDVADVLVSMLSLMMCWCHWCVDANAVTGVLISLVRCCCWCRWGVNVTDVWPQHISDSNTSMTLTRQWDQWHWHVSGVSDIGTSVTPTHQSSLMWCVDVEFYLIRVVFVLFEKITD